MEATKLACLLSLLLLCSQLCSQEVLASSLRGTARLISRMEHKGSSVAQEGALTADDGMSVAAQVNKKKRKKHKPFKTPAGLFIQERASKQLPGPGQHFSFGALQPWDSVHTLLDTLPDSKLLLLIRHGQAISNYLSDELGPDEWYNVEGTCSYTDGNGTTWGVFDADLTQLGEDQAGALNRQLNGAGWFDKLTGGKTARVIMSPLTRCLHTASLVMDGLKIEKFDVEENVRETLGEDTCDARRSASDPDQSDPADMEGPCDFELGLVNKFPQYKFPIVGNLNGERANGSSGFGLLADRDPLWTKDRETQNKQVKRATRFLHDLYTFADEKVVFVVTHSGFARSILLAVGREPYRPQNVELVPIIMQKVQNS